MATFVLTDRAHSQFSIPDNLQSLIKQGANRGGQIMSHSVVATDDSFLITALFSQPNKAIETTTPVLTESEQQAIDRINAVLDGDGQGPESGPGAWGDCGEVDVPILLNLIARLTK